METKCETVSSDEGRKNVYCDENNEKIEEPEVQAEKPEICLCQKSKFQRKFIVPWLLKFRGISSTVREALEKSRKTNIVNQRRGCRVSSGSPTVCPSLSDHKEAKDTPRDNLESHGPEKDQIQIVSPTLNEPPRSIDEIVADRKRTESDSTTASKVKTEHSPKPSENVMLVDGEKLEKIPTVVAAIKSDGLNDDDGKIMQIENLHTPKSNWDEREIMTIDYEALFPSLEENVELPLDTDGLQDDWKKVPILNTTISKRKRAHNCPKACPCIFSQELIEMFHNARKVSEDAEKLSKRANTCKFRMTKSEIDFFKKDMKMCNVMIAEARGRRAEMRELMDMWQEANEKMIIRKKDMKSIIDGIESTTKHTREAENLLTDWLPEGKMEQLRKIQRASEKDEEERLEMLEDNERTMAKEKIEEILRSREKWLTDEKLREEKRKTQRIRGLSNLKNATEIMQEYINKRKCQLDRKEPQFTSDIC